MLSKVDSIIEYKMVCMCLEKLMVCLGLYDGFWIFFCFKIGYSGVCIYVDFCYCVFFKVEEGIIGLFLGDWLSMMKLLWIDVERIGSYFDVNDMEWMDELDGIKFDVKKFDMEGWVVVCDFGWVIYGVVGLWLILS